MQTSMARRLVLGLVICGVLAVAPAAASAATTFATISSQCWLREYPDDTTCDQGWVGAIGIGQTYVGHSVAFFDASWSLPSGAEVTEATLRYDSPYDMYSQADIGVAGGLDWYSDTWWTYDTNNIAVFDSFTPGAAGFNKEVDLTAAVQGWVANSQSSVFLGIYAPGANDYTFLDNLELEIEYEL